jgi:hypothetical protein
MATIIKIKNSGTSGSPSTLATGELAYSYLQQLSIEGVVSTNGGDRLYIGTGTEVAGEATDIVHIGGKYYMDMLDHANGVLTPNSALITDSASKINELKVDNLNLNTNTLSISETNGNLYLEANGTGEIRFQSPVRGSDMYIDTIGSSRVGDGNIFIEPRGTGYVQVSSQNAVRVPVGNTSSRDASPLAGMFRFNSTLGHFEGYDGSAWNTIGGAKFQDIDGNTYVSVENTPGSNNNQIRMFTDGLERQRVENDGSTKFSADLTAGSPVGTKIINNRIETFGSDILYLDPSTGGSNTGSVVVEGNLTIKGTTTTVNSASVQSNNPTLILGMQSNAQGAETALTAPDGLDKGLEFRWHNGTAAKSGFFGYDTSANRFTFIEDATNTNDTFSGTPSDVRFGNALLTELSFTVFTSNSVPWVDVNGDTSFITGDDTSVYNGGDTTGQVLQMNGSGLPVFSHIDCGTY